MGQGEIIEVLEKLTKPCSRGEIAELMKEDPIKVSHWLAILVKHREVETMKINSDEAKEYGCRRRIKLYFMKSTEVNKNGRTKTTRREISTSYPC